MLQNCTAPSDSETPSRKCCISYQLFQRPLRVVSSGTPKVESRLLTIDWIDGHEQGPLRLAHAASVSLEHIRPDRVSYSDVWMRSFASRCLLDKRAFYVEQILVLYRIRVEVNHFTWFSRARGLSGKCKKVA